MTHIAFPPVLIVVRRILFSDIIIQHDMSNKADFSAILQGCQRNFSIEPKKRTNFIFADKSSFFVGGDYGTRTCDLMRVKHAL